MSTHIAPMLAVGDADAAIAFYQAAFGATVSWRLGDGHVVAGLDDRRSAVLPGDGVARNGTRGPSSAGCTTVRIELFVDDPIAVYQRAVAAGATDSDPVREHTHETQGPRPIRRMLQGSVVDPSGHKWLIGKFLD